MADKLNQEELKELLKKEIMKIKSHTDREIVLLKVFADFNIKDISAISGVPEIDVAKTIVDFEKTSLTKIALAFNLKKIRRD